MNGNAIFFEKVKISDMIDDRAVTVTFMVTIWNGFNNKIIHNLKTCTCLLRNHKKRLKFTYVESNVTCTKRFEEMTTVLCFKCEKFHNKNRSNINVPFKALDFWKNGEIKDRTFYFYSLYRRFQQLE